MKAMILAAGHGKRMGKLTEHCAKSLLTVQGKPLITHRIEQLKKAGIRDIVINTYYQAQQFEQVLGDGSALNCHISFSKETEILETAGGIINALPLLGKEPFIITSADTLTDFDFSNLAKHDLKEKLAHLVMVPNPDHHRLGDYGIENNALTVETNERYNYAGFGLLHPKLFEGFKPGFLKISSVFEKMIPKKLISGELHEGFWLNVDTPERLALANQANTAE